MSPSQIFGFQDGGGDFDQEIVRLMILLDIPSPCRSSSSAPQKTRSAGKQKSGLPAGLEKAVAPLRARVARWAFVYLPLLSDLPVLPYAIRNRRGHPAGFNFEMLVCALAFLVIEAHFHIVAHWESHGTQIPAWSSILQPLGYDAFGVNRL